MGCFRNRSSQNPDLPRPQVGLAGKTTTHYRIVRPKYKGVSLTAYKMQSFQRCSTVTRSKLANSSSAFKIFKQQHAPLTTGFTSRTPEVGTDHSAQRYPEGCQLPSRLSNACNKHELHKKTYLNPGMHIRTGSGSPCTNSDSYADLLDFVPPPRCSSAASMVFARPLL